MRDGHHRTPDGQVSMGVWYHRTSDGQVVIRLSWEDGGIENDSSRGTFIPFHLVPQVRRVVLTAVEEADWVVLAKHAQRVETTLLRNVQLMVSGEKISLPITSRLQANFTVSCLELNGIVPTKDGSLWGMLSTDTQVEIAPPSQVQGHGTTQTNSLTTNSQSTQSVTQTLMQALSGQVLWTLPNLTVVEGSCADPKQIDTDPVSSKTSDKRSLDAELEDALNAFSEDPGTSLIYGEKNNSPQDFREQLRSLSCPVDGSLGPLPIVYVNVKLFVLTAARVFKWSVSQTQDWILAHERVSQWCVSIKAGNSGAIASSLTVRMGWLVNAGAGEPLGVWLPPDLRRSLGVASFDSIELLSWRDSPLPAVVPPALKWKPVLWEMQQTSTQETNSLITTLKGEKELQLLDHWLLSEGGRLALSTAFLLWAEPLVVQGQAIILSSRLCIRLILSVPQSVIQTPGHSEMSTVAVDFVASIEDNTPGANGTWLSLAADDGWGWNLLDMSKVDCESPLRIILSPSIFPSIVDVNLTSSATISRPVSSENRQGVYVLCAEGWQPQINHTEDNLIAEYANYCHGHEVTIADIVARLDNHLSWKSQRSRWSECLSWTPSSVLLAASEPSEIKEAMNHLIYLLRHHRPYHVIQLSASAVLSLAHSSRNLQEARIMVTSVFSDAKKVSQRGVPVTLIIHEFEMLTAQICESSSQLLSLSGPNVDSHSTRWQDGRDLEISLLVMSLLKQWLQELEVEQVAAASVYRYSMQVTSGFLSNNISLHPPRATTVLVTSADSMQKWDPSKFGLVGSALPSTVVRLDPLQFKEQITLLRRLLQKFDLRIVPSKWTPRCNIRVQTLLQNYSASDLVLVSRRLRASSMIPSRVVTSMSTSATTIDSYTCATDSSLTSEVSVDQLCSALMACAPASLSSSNSGGLDGDEVVSMATPWDEIPGFVTEKDAILRTLRYPLIFHRLYAAASGKSSVGTGLPTGVLLFGPPGCGKTMLALSIAREFGPLGAIVVRGPALLDRYIGASEAAVRDLFSEAQRRQRPVVIFFDEFDALGAKRGSDNTGTVDRVVNQLLTFLDGVDLPKQSSHHESTSRVFVMAATSRPDLVDPALIRPGRIEKHIYVGLPSTTDALEILRYHLLRFRCEADVESSLKDILQHCRNFTAADLKGLTDSAFLLATEEHLSSCGLVTTSGVVSITAPATDGESPASDQSVVPRVIITKEHLLAAAQMSRPSLSDDDRRFYRAVHARFR